MTDTLPFGDLEKVYDRVATAIDDVGPERESLFLGKLCLTLAHRIGDLTIIEDAIEIAKTDLDT